jgi:hypothetical protein
MTDHIVVFDGNPRLIGRTVEVHIAEATAFTLFGEVHTGEQIGAEEIASCDKESCAPSALVPGGRFGLPVV